MNCAQCGRPVPARRREVKDQIARLFCTDKCAVAYASSFISATRQAELRAEEEIQSELGPDWRRILSEQFAKAASESDEPRKFIPLFVAKAAGHLAPVYAEKWLTRILKGFKETLGKKRKKEEPKKDEKKAAESSDEAFGPAPNGTRPPPSMPVEPPNLEELPLAAQRIWLVRRFNKLAPNATVEQIKTERARLVRALHPDRAQNRPKLAVILSQKLALLNSTFTRIQEIDAELGRPWS